MPLPRPRRSSTALVTGASSSLGSALARQLALRGHHVTLVARPSDRLEEIGERIRDEHRAGADVLPCDLADAEARAALVATLAAGDRQVDVLVNNAGRSTGGDFVAIETAREVEQVRVLVEAVVDLTSAFVPGMVERGSGAVLNVASTAGLQPLPWSAGYAAAKAHTLHFSEALHHELSGRGVAVTALCPGPVETGAPSAMRVDPDWVAEIACYGLERNRRVVVPGAMVRLTALGARWTPRSVQLPALRRAMRPTEDAS